MNTIKLLIAVSLLAGAFSLSAFAQSVTLLEPADGATIWGQIINARWVSEGIDIQPADGQHAEGVGHYHLMLMARADAQLNLKPGEPIGKSDWTVHSTEESYRFENIKPGPYTLFLVLADGQHVPNDPPIMHAVHFNVVAVDPGSGVQETPWWLVALILGGIIGVAYFLTRGQ
ncbi:MAG TPA: DUF4399 domain-containing protein [Candidatus Bipolaricaulota bacterium]